MVKCIIPGCNKNSDDAGISFFKFPEDGVIREAWMRKIGATCIPENMKSIKVCSLHFDDKCFRQPNRTNAGKESKRRRLLHTAIPSIFPECTDQRRARRVTAPPMEVNIIRRSFNLFSGASADASVHTLETLQDDRASTSDDMGNQESQVELGDAVSKVHENNDTDVIQSTCSNPWDSEGFRVTRTPPSSANPLLPVRSCTLPTRSESNSRYRKTTATVHGRPSKMMRLRSGHHSCSAQSTPLSSRTSRYIAENCNISGSVLHSEQTPSMEKQLMLLKEELEHHRSIHRFKSATETNVSDGQEDCWKQQLAEKDEIIKNLCSEVANLKDIVLQLQSELATAKSMARECDKIMETRLQNALKPLFSHGQIRCILENKKWVQWSVEDYAAAISLRSVSPRAYRYLRMVLNFPLPSLASLRRWAFKKFNISEGYLTDVFSVMQEKGKDLSEIEKLSVMCFDEMALSSECNFDPTLEQLIGPHSKVQVIMVRGLFGNWKQPIFYKFDQPMTKSILLEGIKLMHNAGYRVVVVVSDMGNKGLWGELNISPTNYFFKHPVTKLNIYVFADVPHLLKLLRNWYFDNGLRLGGCSELFTTSVLQDIVNFSKTGDLPVAHLLTQQILDVRSSARQNVKPAARIWSNSVAKAIKWAGDKGLLKHEEYRKYSDFVYRVNNWFDVQNSSCQYGSHPGVNGFGVDLTKQEDALQFMNLYIENIRVGNRKDLMPFQKGILISNASLLDLFQDLTTQYPANVKYLLTRRLQQDILENFFSYVRGMGATKDNPSAYDFRYRLRWYILGKHSQAVFTLHRNTEEDLNTSCMSAFASTIANSDLNLSRGVSQDPQPSTPTNFPMPLSSTPFPGVTLHPAREQDGCDKSFASENHGGRDDVIVLTEDIFRDIINMSPENDVPNNAEEDGIEQDNSLHMDEDELFQAVQDGFNNYSCQVVDHSLQMTAVEEAGLQYVAGFVAHNKFHNKYPFLISTAKDTSDWITEISRGGLTYPSNELLSTCKVIEKYFKHFHGAESNSFSKESKVVTKVIALVNSSTEYVHKLPDEVLKYAVHTRTYIRVREKNRRAYENNEQRKRKKKMKKLIAASKN
ncbi:uncharacterized protein [Temnothorax nylanderi]|uniref:uncharacterized protein n=1 Tax=Temnothorax nylanderi TaxID=102681 RepID=UPI003A878BA2